MVIVSPSIVASCQPSSELLFTCFHSPVRSAGSAGTSGELIKLQAHKQSNMLTTMTKNNDFVFIIFILFSINTSDYCNIESPLDQQSENHITRGGDHFSTDSKAGQRGRVTYKFSRKFLKE